MKGNILFLISIVVAGTLCQCPTKISKSYNIISNEIHVQYEKTNQGSSEATYTYPYAQDFGSTPTTALGINGLDFGVSSGLALEALVSKSTGTEAHFLINFNESQSWSQVRINFFSTSRPDIEIGSTSLAAPSKTDLVSLGYQFVNKWNENSFLKFKIFLSAIDLDSQGSNIIKLNLEKADLINKGISLVYSSRGSQTKINKLTVYFVIFDAYNQAFRYAEGIYSQNYLESSLSVDIQSQGVSELRTYMIGLTSFEVNTNSTISLSSSMSENFQLNVGPTSKNCVINHITVSYVIISIFTKCGACLPYTILYGDNCVEECPQNYYANNGTCQPLTCQYGFYLLNGRCTQCPKRSNIKECNNSCLEGEKLVGESCVPICQESNQKYSYGQCICIDNYYKINNICQTCPEGTRFNGTACQSICSTNGYYDYNSKSCLCNPGFNAIHGSCIQCKSGQVFELVWGGCRPECGAKQIFNGQKCICENGLNFVGGVCVSCAVNEIYNSETQTCVSRCKTNEVWAAYYCQCKEGFYKINGSCQTCAADQTYDSSIQKCRPNCLNGQFYTNGQCQCISGSYLIGGVCQICPASTFYNSTLQSCEQYCKKRYEQYINRECLCISGTVRNASSGECVANLCPEFSSYNYTSETCICNKGYYLNAQSASCLPLPVCKSNEILSNGECICSEGYVKINGKCAQCNTQAYEIFNGIECVCIDGFSRTADGKCSQIIIPICPPSELYNKNTKTCDCKSNFTRVNGNCVIIPNCLINQYFNGQACVCDSGYILNSTTNKCDPIKVVEPKCYYNSYFNGVKCVCNDKFFELSPGLCAICAPLMSWNGRKCAYDKECWAGYKWNEESECCLPEGPQCPVNSAWDGINCQCNSGYYSIDNQCIKCQAGYQFDGAKCSRVEEPVICTGINKIVINNKCVCKPGTNLYLGSCIVCNYPTVWNGQYCQGNNDGCFTVPNSVINPITRRCECLDGYRGVQGTCIPVVGPNPCNVCQGNGNNNGNGNGNGHGNGNDNGNGHGNGNGNGNGHGNGNGNWFGNRDDTQWSFGTSGTSQEWSSSGLSNNGNYYPQGPSLPSYLPFVYGKNVGKI